MSIAYIYKEGVDVTILGSPKDLEALGHILIAKAKLGKNLSAKLVADTPNIPNIKIEIYDDE